MCLCDKFKKRAILPVKTVFINVKKGISQLWF